MPGPVLVCAATTRLAVAAHTAALTAGLLPAGPSWRTVLLAAEEPGPGIAARFGTVLRWDDEFGPLRPDGWTPRVGDLPVLERLLTDRWSLTGPLHLVVDGIAGLRSLAPILSRARITVCVSDLASYGPTPVRLPVGVGSRITSLLHLDLLPGASPVLLHEYDRQPVPIPLAALPALLGVPADPPHGVLLLGESLTRRAALPQAVEDRLTATALRAALRARPATPDPDPPPGDGDLVRGPRRRGHGPRVWFAGETVPRGLVREARRLGVPVHVVADPWSVRPALVVGHAGPELAAYAALARAGALPGTAVAALGAGALAGGAERVAAVLVDRTVPRLTGGGRIVAPPPAADLQESLRALAYTLRPGHLPELREDALRHLAGPSAPRSRFPAAGLAALDLPVPSAGTRLRRVLSPGGRPRHGRPVADQPGP
ncbi:hypothetical protein LO762_18460 [Actinocorallia sp. API 0066]|uniref:hypothetical protein n=1 Tax=Actinocorallia sp. API 0066 TaxID=2896846 RepID=UPI001E5616D8|nr:hypothetical protein [Actinocorallia sp. API 0066]MCD0451166.1 hypothetical protein [Actinocorallia sp. API 0066]